MTASRDPWVPTDHYTCCGPSDRLAAGYLPTVEGALLGAPPDGALRLVLDDLVLLAIQLANQVNKKSNGPTSPFNIGG